MIIVIIMMTIVTITMIIICGDFCISIEHPDGCINRTIVK